MSLPYVAEKTVKGRLYRYYRRGKLYQRLPGEPGSAEFNRAYEALQANAAPVRQAPTARSIAALILAYRASPDWRQLRPATHRDYDKALRPLEERYGDVMVAGIPRPFVKALQQKYATKIATNADGSQVTIATPRRANRMVAVLSILMSWAVDHGWRSDNPCLRPRRLRTGPGWRSWTEAELQQVLQAPTTPEHVRLAILLAVCTGQRGEDLIRMTWPSYDGTGIDVTQQKTAERVWVPCTQALRDRLAAEPRRTTTILSRPVKRSAGGALHWASWRIDYFRHIVAKAIADAGVKGVVIHGLRAMASTRLAEAGNSEAMIQSILGHRSVTQSAHYHRGANQKRLATAAITRLEDHLANTERETAGERNGKPDSIKSRARRKSQLKQ